MSTAIIRTFTGKYIDLLDPKPEDIDIRDIAHGLSLLCRFNGQCNFFYSVAEHTLNGVKLIRDSGYWDKEIAIQAWLLHDADEAYLGDMTSPLKSVIPEYKKIQEHFSKVINDKYNVPCVDHEYIKAIDRQIFSLEKEMVFLDLAANDMNFIEEKLLDTFKEYGIA